VETALFSVFLFRKIAVYKFPLKRQVSNSKNSVAESYGNFEIEI